jgi:hypothetical protein
MRVSNRIRAKLPALREAAEKILAAPNATPANRMMATQGHEDGGFHPAGRRLRGAPRGPTQALERKGEEPLRGKKAQKAPGSDGGLFDDNSHGWNSSSIRSLLAKFYEKDPLDVLSSLRHGLGEARRVHPAVRRSRP